MKICQKEGCNNPVWGKGYCKYHQYLRTDTVKKIKPVSTKRNLRNENYEKIKSSMEFKKCFFCGLLLDASDKNKPHHLVPRSYSMEFFDDPQNLVPVHFSCHREFHDMALSDMWTMPWYPEWMRAIKMVSGSYYEIMKFKTQHYNDLNRPEDY